MTSFAGFDGWFCGCYWSRNVGRMWRSINLPWLFCGFHFVCPSRVSIRMSDFISFCFLFLLEWDYSDGLEIWEILIWLKQKVNKALCKLKLFVIVVCFVELSILKGCTKFRFRCLKEKSDGHAKDKNYEWFFWDYKHAV